MFSKEIMEIISTAIHALCSSEKDGFFIRCHQFAGNVTRAWQRKKVAALLSGYLDENLWREKNGRNGPAAFENILSHIAEIYSEDRENQPDL